MLTDFRTKSFNKPPHCYETFFRRCFDLFRSNTRRQGRVLEQRRPQSAVNLTENISPKRIVKARIRQKKLARILTKIERKFTVMSAPAKSIWNRGAVFIGCINAGRVVTMAATMSDKFYYESENVQTGSASRPSEVQIMAPCNCDVRRIG